MKRYGNLLDSIACVDNVRLVFLRAVRGKPHKPEVQVFVSELDKNLDDLCTELMQADVKWGAYKKFYVWDPKKRLIHAPSFRDRVAHHALMNICVPAFESFQIHDSYACRVNKGTYAALDRAGNFTAANKWYLKMDVRRYFDSIRQEVLMSMPHRRFKDKKVLQLLRSVIDTYNFIIWVWLLFIERKNPLFMHI